MNRLVILGAGQQGRICKRLAHIQGYNVECFIDDYINGEVENVPVFKSITEVHDYQKCKYIVAVGDTEVRRNFIKIIDSLSLECINLIDPTADIEEGAVIGTGNFIYKFASVYSSATIGNHNIINCKAVVAADAVIGDNCNICMGSNICGAVQVGNNSYIGYQATVVSGYNVGEKAYVEAGSVVKRDINDGEHVTGLIK